MGTTVTVLLPSSTGFELTVKLTILSAVFSNCPAHIQGRIKSHPHQLKVENTAWQEQGEPGYAGLYFLNLFEIHTHYLLIEFTIIYLITLKKYLSRKEKIDRFF